MQSTQKSYFVNKFYLLVKYAQTTKLLDKLNSLNPSNEIKDYILLLEDKYKGQAINFLAKNISSSLVNLELFVNELKAKEQKVESLKQKDILKIKSILSNLDSDIPAKLESWLILQLKQYPNKFDVIKSNYYKIKQYVIEYDIDLPSYNIDSLLEYIEVLSGNVNIKSDSEEVLKFLTKAHDLLKEKINALTNNDVKKWATKKSIDIIRGWLKQITSAIKKENKSFAQFLQESHQIKQDFDNGLYRNRDLPNTPLMYNEYDKLSENLEIINIWINDTNNNIAEYSILEAVNNANNYNKNNVSYDKINKSNIIKGPNNWSTKEYNGYFILELKSRNDLKVEGLLMNHCVGGYFSKVESGESRIFSIRKESEPYNPIVTFEASTNMSDIIQNMGPHNSKIDNFYIGMIDELVSTTISFETLTGFNIFCKKTKEEQIQIINNNTNNIKFLTKILAEVAFKINKDVIDYVIHNFLDKTDFHRIYYRINENDLMSFLSKNKNNLSADFIDDVINYCKNDVVMKFIVNNFYNKISFVNRISNLIAFMTFDQIKNVIDNDLNNINLITDIVYFCNEYDYTEKEKVYNYIVTNYLDKIDFRNKDVMFLLNELPKNQIKNIINKNYKSESFASSFIKQVYLLDKSIVDDIDPTIFGIMVVNSDLNYLEKKFMYWLKEPLEYQIKILNEESNDEEFIEFFIQKEHYLNKHAKEIYKYIPDSFLKQIKKMYNTSFVVNLPGKQVIKNMYILNTESIYNYMIENLVAEKDNDNIDAFYNLNYKQIVYLINILE